MYVMRRPKSGVDRYASPGFSSDFTGDRSAVAGRGVSAVRYMRRRIGFFLLTALFFSAGIITMIR